MAYYDHIAKSWHEMTGYKGGAFKELVLNKILLDQIPAIHGRSILELGAGNGYFLPLLFRKMSGQVAKEIVVTDKSERLIEIARKHFRIDGAVYKCVDVCKSFPFPDGRFNLVIASMIFNELPSGCFTNALRECQRVLTQDNLLLISVMHPDFVMSLEKRDLLKKSKDGILTMPGTGTLRLPVLKRSLESYRASLSEAGFDYTETPVNSSRQVLSLKAGLRKSADVPVALVFACRKARQ